MPLERLGDSTALLNEVICMLLPLVRNTNKKQISGVGAREVGLLEIQLSQMQISTGAIKEQL